MPLPSFIPYRRRKPRVDSKSSSSATQNFEPHTFTDISTTHEQAVSTSTSTASTTPAQVQMLPVPIADNALPSPHVKFDFELDDAAKPSEWFSSGFTELDVFLDRNIIGQMTADDSTSTRKNSFERNGLEGDSAVDYIDEGREEGKSSSISDIITDSEEIITSNIDINHSRDNSVSSLPHPDYELTRKNVPSPIKIPSMPSNGPTAQVMPLDVIQASPHSRPDSQVSTPNSSAVSGTTLARALIANTFVLSGDTRMLRYRSSVSNLTRSDSATLPKEHSFSKLPHLRDGSIVGDDSSGGYGLVSLVPPIPMNAELLYVPPKTSRSPLTTHDIQKKFDGHVSTAGLNVESEPTLVSSLGHRAKTTSESVQPMSTILGTSHTRLRKPTSEVSSPIRTTSNFDTMSPDQSSTSNDTSSSIKDINNVWDSHSVADIQSGDHFRPAFSPISEESSSQLSSLSSVPNRSKRASTRSYLGEKIIPTGASSSGKAAQRRTPQSMYNSSLSQYPLLPIGERPRSIQNSSGLMTSSLPPSSRMYSSSPMSQLAVRDGQSKGIRNEGFNRPRSDSAPNPIVILRDSNDSTPHAVNFNTNPRGQMVVTPTIEDIGGMSSASSPLLSSDSPSSPMVLPGDSGNYTGMSGPQISVHPAQWVSLTRAATSVQRAKPLSGVSLDQNSRDITNMHSRSFSMGINSSSRDTFDTPSSSTPATINSVVSSSSREVDLAELQEIKIKPFDKYAVLSTSPDESKLYEPGESQISAVKMSQSGLDRRIPPKSLLPQKNTGSANKSQNDLSSSDPPLLLNTAIPPKNVKQLEDPLFATTLPSNPVDSNTTSFSHVTDHTLDLITDVAAITETAQLSTRQSVENVPMLPPPPRHHVHSMSLPSFTFANVSDLDTLKTDQTISSKSTSQSTIGRNPYFHPERHYPNTITSVREHSVDEQPSIEQPTGRTRVRPPLPVGPRRPSQPPPVVAGLGPKMYNNSELMAESSLLRNTGRGFPSSTLAWPKFETPTPKWRGFSLDAAKWTFDSEQLQTIVSRAIRHSAEASSIRILQLETLDDEIPAELRRLEIQRTDTTTGYKILAQKRTDLLEMLSRGVDGSFSNSKNTTNTLRLVDELKTISSSLDNLAETLHSVDEQIAQLDSLCQVHSASALAMALRNINTRFLNEKADAQALRQRVETLEAERDEAWKQAEIIATEYDHLREEVGADPRSPKRTSHISAARKSTIIASNAGLRISDHFGSQHSSMSSNCHRSSLQNVPSDVSSRTTFFLREEPISRVPGQAVPVNIEDDLPARSFIDVSTGGLKPRTALMRAQGDLYDVVDFYDKKNRRSQSVREAPRASLDQVASQRYPSPIDLARPVSFPGGFALSEAYNVMAGDCNAMLATLEMFSE